MIKIAKKIEKLIIYSLIIMMTGVLILATIELGYYLFRAVFDSQYLLLGMNELNDLFGAFLLVLIGIELLDTIKVYLKESVVHVEVVVLVAIIALARKVVILKVEALQGETIIGIGLLIVALAVAYYLIKKSGLMRYDVGEIIDKGDNEAIVKIKKKKKSDKVNPKD